MNKLFAVVLMCAPCTAFSWQGQIADVSHCSTFDIITINSLKNTPDTNRGNLQLRIYDKVGSPLAEFKENPESSRDEEKRADIHNWSGHFYDAREQRNRAVQVSLRVLDNQFRSISISDLDSDVLIEDTCIVSTAESEDATIRLGQQ